jgi:hypothetical protein
VNQFVILEQVAFRLIQFVQQLVFKVSQLDSELALQLDDVVSLLIDLWSLFFE